MVSLSNNTQGNVNITTKSNNVNLSTENDTDINANTNGNSQRAKSWAVGEGLIDGVDYSAKYYAGQAKESEEIASRAVEDIDTAKESAINEIETTKETCITDVNTAGNNKITEIENLASDFEDNLTALTQRAETAAGNAETSETNAANSATSAATSATSASTSATNASNSATSAATNANLALGYKNDAYTSADFAGQYKTAAEQAKTNAQYYRTQASGYASQASNAATGAIQSAIRATQAQTIAESARDAAGGYAQQAEQAKEDIEAELDNYVPNTRKVNNKPLSTDITLTSSDIGALANTTKYGYSVALSLDTTNYKLTLTLKDQDGTALSTKTVDFPIESVVVNGSYDSTNKKIVLTLQSGSTIDIPVGDLISGLQSEITSTNKLDADLVDDTNSSHKFATAAQLSQIATNTSSISNLATVATSGNYNDLTNKPTIPAAQVQADWDVTDTTSKAYIKNKPYIPSGVVIDQTFDGTSENAQSGVGIQSELSTNYQSKLVSGTNIKSINNTSLLGSGNIEVLQNTANHDDSLCIYGTLVSGMSKSEYGTAVGYHTQAGVYSNAFGKFARATGSWAEAFGGNCTASGDWAIRVGHNGDASGQYSIAIGGNASASAHYAIQLGSGTNSTASSLQIGFGTSNNYTLLDGTTGLIPDERISSNIARASALSSYQPLLESGTNIKTINSTSLLGSGNIAVQPTLVSGTNIKTLNNTSLLGSGNISLAEDDTTISKNSDDELQTIGVIDDNVQNAYNFTVVGSPKITEDGIVSGFSNSNYITGSFTSITPSKIIFRTKAVYSSTPNAAKGSQVLGRIQGTNSSPSIEYNQNANRLAAVRFHNNSSTANSSASITVPLNDGDIVEAEVIATSTSVTLNAKINGVPYTNTWSGNGLYCGAINGYVISNNSNWYWTGSIDLKQFSITVDGVEVYRAWQPPALKYWTGTKAQYDAIATKNANTLYNVEGVGLYKGTTLISNDGADKDLSNLSTTGQAIIDGKANTTLSNVSSIDSNSAVATALDGKVNNDDYYYKSGDTVTLDCAVGGYATTSGTEISFTITLPKSLVNITSINCTALVTSFRKSNGGYAPSASWNAKANAQSISIYRVSDCQLQFLVKYGSFGLTNNTPVGCQINSVSLSFT